MLSILLSPLSFVPVITGESTKRKIEPLLHVPPAIRFKIPFQGKRKSQDTDNPLWHKYFPSFLTGAPLISGLPYSFLYLRTILTRTVYFTIAYTPGSFCPELVILASLHSMHSSCTQVSLSVVSKQDYIWWFYSLMQKIMQLVLLQDSELLAYP